MAGLLDTFTIARRGLTVQQGNINTSSHNISNIDTEGYSRQRAVSETTRPFGGMSRFDTTGAGQVGTGAEITSIQRIRDYFIDYQYRSASGTSGYYTQQNQTLSKVEDIFGEPSDTGIQELTSQFFSSFQEVSKTPDKADVKTVAIKNAQALADAINYTYNQLEKTNQDSQKLLESNVTDVNSYLNQINELNKEIRSVSAVGQTPNDLMDKRDNLVDKLSEKFGIKLDRDKLDTINLSSTEYPDSAFVKSDPNDTDYSRLSYIDTVTAATDSSGNLTGDVTVKYYPLGNENSTLQTVTIKTGSATDAKSLKDELTQCRILITDKDGKLTMKDSSNKEVEVGDGGTVSASQLTELKTKIFQTYKYDTSSGTAVNNVDNNHVKGDIAANQSVQETIQGYMDNLDRLAAALGYSVNALQVGSLDTANSSLSSSELIFVTYDETNKTTTSTDKGLTAKNIRINANLLADTSKLNCNTSSASGEGDGKRANAIANLNTIKMNFSNIAAGTDFSKIDRKSFLTSVGMSGTTGFSDNDCLKLNAGTTGSTVDSYYKSVINNIAVATQEASRQQDSQEDILADIQDQRSQVSGVSLDEETTNLIQYQHAYQANAKVISTIDELLDVVINGLKK
ncbi:flagellar hook-associated protein FlgK [Clostridium beijerinckii]|uniref:Flagellar hook-associated protein 1 n=1 Tax=Clostridium beijerinckii TaxID=1520 RepID=A0A9Q5CTK3_CLOBE|nr:flagellar hook-associated protein FlgK [Clostridium beijerinckii]AQS07152.1 flagellar hook-associated protein 1 [Clostridium beijerinckii]MBA2883648.1 flagellar hook-associated protein 1 FlgK [Clostridium beijerinckii]MBA2898835.1 flagellar hook-associated protein 1 FlgK [Clostridium beijerinckii]MBA2908235.1 flagellar hook-associated protein 1 FlgK [Clostridium beijerinckii]MBA9013216.1 flagellar hook-associated protein 1 FlgK [Clostridium beijerinckii]